MIIRNFVARQGRSAFARNSIRPIRRFLSSESQTINTPAANSAQQAQLLDSQTNASLSGSVPSIGGQAATADQPMSIAEQYQLYQQHQQSIGKIGSDISPHYKPHTLLNNPPSVADVTLELLLASEAHQGHATSLWNPANARYIHGIRQGVHIISLEVTAAHLRRSAKIVQEVCRRGGIVLFVGTRDGQDRAVVRAAELAKGYHLFERWIPGSITNGQQILGKCALKVVNEKDEEVPGFEDQLNNFPVLRPDLVVCLNPLENYVLLHECALNNIPTIGVIDTNADPTWVTYPIPANDDSHRCTQVIAGVLGRAGEAGQKQRLEAAEKGEVTYSHTLGLVLPEEFQEKDSEMESGLKQVLQKDERLEKNDKEIEDKLEDAENDDGRRGGHRLKLST
ncbi:37S ribosomal protein MRP4, mitochondrial precursor [Dendryphion nanum]|uniref:37S ribosomal protein MRP4, mitochondrial n=1 Tax=Dendryphion nanum TaxID=256645 RepID=A0A9P9EIC9_9PLEO|nr:37S ribosomal protein MRP4, mitochondrial precursor [Dendryphion nanum]